MLRKKKDYLFMNEKLAKIKLAGYSNVALECENQFLQHC